MIQVEHLTKDYGTFRALNDIQFHVDKGEIVGFLGPNGAGKTTTMRILTGYLPPTAGQAHVAGFDVFEDSLQVRQRVGYLPESVPLYPEMTVRAYLDYMATLHHVADRQGAVQKAMEACALDGRAGHLIGRLSKGFRQRVGLAQAILHEPEVLILDEPTIGLDPKQIIEVRELIKALGETHTVILSTHILPEVSQICDRVLIIHKGQIVAEGTPDELTTQLQGGTRVLVHIAPPETEETAAVATTLGSIQDVLGSIPDILGIEQHAPGRYEVRCAPDVDRRAALARAIVDRGWDLLELRAVDMSLEDIFLRLTTEEVPAKEQQAADLLEEPHATLD